MPGFLGGSTGSSGGTGGEISFPKEFIDPVTKLRISQPENLIDTDFEYGLQPTKWETVELINNTPSFFSKSGDTTIPNILAISTNSGTREITVLTAVEHGLAVGIPINVTGTKSVTADGSYVINSIPNSTTFTYLCKDNQQGNNSIEDLYTSIITGEFFQGSQIRISDAEGITTNAAATSILTVKTDSTHGFGLQTPFYFLNLNSTISQEFEASNTAAKSFDSSNSATAQTFDGSNTLSTFNIDWSNSATVGGVASTITGVSTGNDTISVTHTTETFAGKTVGTPLYYNLTTPASSGYFLDNPRGVVFLKTTNSLNVSSVSTFQVSGTPDGDPIDIVSSMQGTFQLANQARTFAGNNVNAATEIVIPIIKDDEKAADLSNDGGGFAGNQWRVANVASYSGSLVNLTSTNSSGTSLDFYTGAMVLYSTTGSAATGLTNNTTYFVDSFFSTGGANYAMTLKPLPTSAALTSISGGSGTQSFTRIGLSVDRDIVHIRNSNYAVGDLLRYTYSAGARFTLSDAADVKDFYIVETVYDAHNYAIASKLGISATGGTITEAGGFRYHAFTTVGTSSFVVTGDGFVEVLVVAGGGGGGGSYGGGGGGGAGGLVYHSAKAVTSQSYTVVVGAGGVGGTVHDGSYGSSDSANHGRQGGNSQFGDIIAQGGGGGNMSFYSPSNFKNGGSGGGGGDFYQGVSNHQQIGGTATQGNSGGGLGYGNPGGSRGSGGPTANEDGGHAQPHEGAGGGGAGGVSTGGNSNTPSNGGIGRQYSQFAAWGSPAGWFAGGGGGGTHYGGGGIGGDRTNPPGTGGAFGGGGRGTNEYGQNFSLAILGTVGVANTGGGGGGGSKYHNGGTPGSIQNAPNGGSGIVLVRYAI